MFRDENVFLSIPAFEMRTRIEIKTTLTRMFESAFLLVSGMMFSKKAANFSNFLKIVCLFLKIFFYKSHFPDKNENIFLSRNSILEREYLSINLVLKMTTKN